MPGRSAGPARGGDNWPMVPYRCNFRAPLLGAFLALLQAATAPAFAASNFAASVYLEELTSPEVGQRVAAGSSTILVPIGGTEQNGPHMVLGKHNLRSRVLAGAIAQRLGNALVAPVLAYVPQGSIRPPAAHMRYAGTISIPEATFESLLESVARSFKQHGFRQVVFLGDHGGYRKNIERVAARLNREWAADPACRVQALPEYYRAAQGGFGDALKAQGYAPAEIGSHAGLLDTALALAVDPALVRPDMLARAAAAPGRDGVQGDPRRATAELGRPGVQGIVDASVAAIQALPRQ